MGWGRGGPGRTPGAAQRRVASSIAATVEGLIANLMSKSSPSSGDHPSNNLPCGCRPHHTGPIDEHSREDHTGQSRGLPLDPGASPRPRACRRGRSQVPRPHLPRPARVPPLRSRGRDLPLPRPLRRRLPPRRALPRRPPGPRRRPRQRSHHRHHPHPPLRRTHRPQEPRRTHARPRDRPHQRPEGDLPPRPPPVELPAHHDGPQRDQQVQSGVHLLLRVRRGQDRRHDVRSRAQLHERGDRAGERRLHVRAVGGPAGRAPDLLRRRDAAQLQGAEEDGGVCARAGEGAGEGCRLLADDQRHAASRRSDRLAGGEPRSG